MLCSLCAMQIVGGGEALSCGRHMQWEWSGDVCVIGRENLEAVSWLRGIDVVTGCGVTVQSVDVLCILC